MLLQLLSNDRVTATDIVFGFVQLSLVWATQYKREMGILNPANGQHGDEKTGASVRWERLRELGHWKVRLRKFTSLKYTLFEYNH